VLGQRCNSGYGCFNGWRTGTDGMHGQLQAEQRAGVGRRGMHGREGGSAARQWYSGGGGRCRSCGRGRHGVSPGTQVKSGRQVLQN
jgi:hypothetical protein